MLAKIGTDKSSNVCTHFCIKSSFTSDYSKTHITHSFTSLHSSSFHRNEALRTWETSYLLALQYCSRKMIDISSYIVFIFFSLCIAIMKEKRDFGIVNNGVSPQRSTLQIIAKHIADSLYSSPIHPFSDSLDPAWSFLSADGEPLTADPFYLNEELCYWNENNGVCP